MHSSPDQVNSAKNVQGPLSGIKVVAVEHSVAGPLASRMLAEMGAQVIKIEKPEAGDFSRHWDANVAGEGAQFWWLNRFKQSVALDVKSEEGAAILDALLIEADVLIHNLAPPSAARLGLDQETIAERYPRLVNCQISGFGADGPESSRKAYDMLIQAEAGVMSLTGTPEQPMRVGVSISDVSTGIYSALLILGALLERERTDLGRTIDVAMFDVTLEFLGPMLTSYLNAGTIYPRIPDQHHAIAPYGVFECGDGGRVLIAIEQDGEWHRLCDQVFNDVALSSDERYLSNVLRLEHRSELSEKLAERFAALETEATVAALAAAGLAYAQVNDVAAVAEHSVVRHRDGTANARSESGEKILHLRGIPERVFGAPQHHRERPPTLGEDTGAVLGPVRAAADHDRQGGSS